MKKRPKPEKPRRDNPERTRDMIAKARPAKEVLPKIFGARTAATMLKPRGQPKSPDSKSCISGAGTAIEYIALEYYWVFKYEVAA